MEYISYGLNVVMLFVAYVLWQAVCRAASQTIYARERLAEKEREVAGVRMALQMQSITTPQLPTADKTTADLIRLAVKNPNENEARTAALKACKRMYEKIK